MKRAMTLLAVVAVVGLVCGMALSEEAKPPVVNKGVVVKVDAEAKVVVLKVKQEGAEAKEVKVAYDDKTKVLVGEKDGTIADVKAEARVAATMSEDGKVAVKIVVMVPKPKKTE